jgi:tetratricopeptide (TPR) repeat protein
MYLVWILVLFGASLLYGVSSGRVEMAIIGLAIVILFPAMIQGFFWHDFFLGRNLVRKGQWNEAIGHFNNFQLRLKKHPWLKHLILLRWSSYTNNVEAITHNNIALAHINRGELDMAEKSCQEALESDPLYPVPYFHLALIEKIKGNDSKARDLWRKSRELGYDKVDFDDLKILADSLKRQKEKK